jgi:hypothetical protein
MTKSQIEKGIENTERLFFYLNRVDLSGGRLPRRAGVLNRSAIAKACDFDRQVLYQNPAAVKLLEKYDAKDREKFGDAGLGDSEPINERPRRDFIDSETAKRFEKLKNENSELTLMLAERETTILALRRRLAAYEAQSAILVESGLILRTRSSLKDK